MFSDSVELTISSGRGGAGSTSFRREKHVIQGGPDGGDGGHGGNVFFKVDRNSHTLANFRGLRALKAASGQNGMRRRMHGKKGEDLIIGVPPGTQVIDVESGQVLLDLIEENEKILFLEGGMGGLGNWHFRSSTNQQPRYAQPGLVGKSVQVRLELKLIADVGLVGFPNVGKSTLISVVSNAKPQIANYEFTTLTPKLGVVEVDEDKSFVMADIPGIIEGASEGKGLGLEFLKHIERTKFLLFMLDVSNYRDLEEQFFTLHKELENFSQTLAKRDFAIALTKLDAVDEEEAHKKISAFLKKIKIKPSKESKTTMSFPHYMPEIYDNKKGEVFFVLPISSATNYNIKPLIYTLNDSILKIQEDEEKSSN